MPITSLIRYDADMKLLFKSVPNLKSLIKISDNRNINFNEVFIQTPLLSKNPQLIGHAYDYFLQLLCERLNRCNSNISSNMILYNELPESFQYDSEKNIEIYTSGLKEWNYDMTKQSIIYGKLDQYYRSGVPPVDIMNVEDEDIKDLHSLITSTMKSEHIFKAKYRFISNPHFGSSISMLMGGADADLIIDDSLIDIKVRSKLRFESYPWHQLIGYYVLGLLTPNINYKIKRISIWNPRYEILMYINIDDLFNIFDFKKFVVNFIETAIVIYRKKDSSPTYLDYIKDVRLAWEINSKNLG
ncbi:hypothetical protein PPYC2_16535 [Paenibacillus polymyxa]|nr:hypothetical protein PPYC2_16535 [Paenibacillus polymyxa]